MTQLFFLISFLGLDQTEHMDIWSEPYSTKHQNCSDRKSLYSRIIGRSENPGVPVLFGGHNLPPLIEIRLSDLPKSGGAMATPAFPDITGLDFFFFMEPKKIGL